MGLWEELVDSYLHTGLENYSMYHLHCVVVHTVVHSLVSPIPSFIYSPISEVAKPFIGSVLNMFSCK